MSVTVPALPLPTEPDAGNWNATVAAAIGNPDTDTLVVAHSLGCLTALRYLMTLSEPWRLGSLVLVAGFLEPLPALPQLDGYIADGCDVDGLSGHIDRLTVVRSDADDYVPVGHTDRLAARLGTAALVSTRRGHFLDSDGARTVPEVLAVAVGTTPRPGMICGTIANGLS